MEIFLRISFCWDLLQFINGLLLANFNASSLLGFLFPTNCLSCEGHITQSSEPTWKSLPSLAGTRCILSYAASASVRTRGLFEMLSVSFVPLVQAHNVTVHIIKLSFKKSCFEINVKKIPSVAGCHLTTHSKSRSCGGRRISL